ncbi:MAG: hypothetical protein HN423_08490 [Alphaproteobacteria bacterium]|nr:hypothetical protein [Alphaproteobacteria bacterium]
MTMKIDLDAVEETAKLLYIRALKVLPDDIKDRFSLWEGWRSKVERVGFVIEDYESLQSDLMDDPDDGWIAKAVIERGITLHKQFATIIARKP